MRSPIPSPCRARRFLLGGLLALSLALVSCGHAPLTQAQPATPEAVTLSHTFVHQLPASDSGRPYWLWVSVPRDYEQLKDRKLPVVFATDAPYTLPLMRGIHAMVGNQGRNIEPFILVGLGYEPGLPQSGSRSRDYTPSNPLRKPDYRRDVYRAAVYGEAARYRDYLERQVLPFVREHYRADLSRSTFVGQSYGGLFGTYVLLTRPELFQTYLLGSPSLWFDERAIWEIESRYAARHRDLKARVRLYAGSFETDRPEPRYTPGWNLLGDMKEFEALLRSRGYPGLEISSETLVGEDHRTMGPGFFTQGLLWALPGYGPYDPS
ncbi:alpha/beta hydrolase [Roseateles sp.]|jgi:predicted alpha/beta superfamily hydrolase|uniref:alpha/beta hydrolase n=1 Tax=Roseateles sp. TaxID=1971397 RepID=UPI00391A7083